MRIGIDIRPLQNNNRFRGVGRYLENVLRHIAPIANDHTFIFYAESGGSLPKGTIGLFKHSETKFVAKSKIKHIKYVRALSRPYVKIRVNSRDVDVFFQGDPWLGIPKNVPTVATFYDLIPMFFKIDKESMNLSGIRKYKQIFRGNVESKYYQQILDSYKSAEAILAISNASKNDFVHYIDKSAKDKIFVIPLAGSGHSFPKVTTALRKVIRKKYKLDDSPFLLYVGGVDSRKNIVSLAKDFVRLKKNHKNLKMVMVGNEFKLKRNLKIVGWSPFLKKHPIEARDILTPGFVVDDELAVLYKEAAMFVFPSLYEGFGLPILEAMHLSCPVVCYNNSSLPEVAGDAALIVPNGESLVPAIASVLSDDRLRKELVAKGKKQVKKFTWGKTATETLNILEIVGKGSAK